MPFLGIADASGIQSYIFRSSELRAIAKASKTIEDMCLTGGLYERCEAGTTKLILAAGGNATFRSDNLDDLKATFRAISRELLASGSGLEIIPAIFAYDEGKLASAYPHAMRSLERRKLTQPRNTDFLFPGLEKPLADPEQQREVRQETGYALPHDLSKMIVTEEDIESDLMAVVSIDGLGMGSRLIQWMTAQKEQNIGDDDFCEQFRLWSKSIVQRWATAWENALRKIEAFFVPDENGVPSFAHPYQTGTRDKRILRLTQEKDPKHKNYMGYYLPCRKIYQGGDDLSFVCDARIALALTAYLMQQLETLSAGEGVGPLFQSIPTSAGVLFVDSHFPFSRAVTIAEEVRKAAKKRSTEVHNNLDEERRKNTLPSSYLDWWLNRQAAMIRPEPTFPGGSLRPYALRDNSNTEDKFSWESLEASVFPGIWELFATSRNKLKDLQAAAETGEPTEVSRLLQLRPITLEKGTETKQIMRLDFVDPFDPVTGFEDKKTILLDVIELYDIHFPFPSEGGNTNA